MKNKRGQGTSPTASVAILILLIALFMIVYVLLIPPDVREDLLGKKSTGVVSCFEDCDDEYDDCLNQCSSSGCRSDCRLIFERCRSDCDVDVISGGRNLLSESPGVVFPQREELFFIDLTDIALFSRVETKPILLAKSLSVSRSLFSDNFKTLNFELDNLDEIEELGLLFFISDSKGILRVKINGNLIYEGLAEVNDLPIVIPLTFLKKNNILEISVSSPGINIFGTNRYNLLDVNLVKKLKVENTEAKRTFSVFPSEARRLKGAFLDYYIYCNDLRANGRLEIKLNDKLLYPTDIIVCDVDQPALDIDLGLLKEGNNVLGFSIDKGDYRIEQLQIGLDISDVSFPKYNFDIDSDEFNMLYNGLLDVVLDIKFKDSDNRKKASVTINDNILSFDTRQSRYVKDISNFVYEGANHIKIIPDKEFEIVSLQIYLE